MGRHNELNKDRKIVPRRAGNLAVLIGVRYYSSVN